MTANHSPAPEELMAYLDGEQPPEAARYFQGHLATCERCQLVAQDLRLVSNGLRAWHVEEPPDALRVPQLRTDAAPAAAGGAMAAPAVLVRLSSTVWRVVRARPYALSAAAAVVVLVAAALLQPALKQPPPMPVRPAAAPTASDHGSSRPAPLTGGAGGHADASAQAPAEGQATPPAGSLVARTIRLRIVATDLDAARPLIDRVIRDVGGLVGHVDASSAPGAPRFIRATLRVPAARLEEALASLRQLGRVTHESQQADDATEQAVDLDARIANGRITEKRLAELLRNRTGRVADVLEVEREMARVRTEIERLEAQREKLQGRVAYAMLILEAEEERRAKVDLGPIPLRARLRLAAVDGLGSAASTAVNAALLLLRAGPAILVWIALLLPAWWLLRGTKRRRERAIPDR